MTRIALIFALTFGLSAIEASPSSDVPSSIIGHWSAPPDRVPLSDGNAWGKNVSSVRRAELRINPDGTGTILVTRSVERGAGVPLAGSRIIDRADFVVGPQEQPTGLRPRYTTSIKSASRRYPDPPIVETSIADGLTVEIFPPDETTSGQLELDFQVFSGDGSFSALLQRQRTTATGH